MNAAIPIQTRARFRVVAVRRRRAAPPCRVVAGRVCGVALTRAAMRILGGTVTGTVTSMEGKSFRLPKRGRHRRPKPRRLLPNRRPLWICWSTKAPPARPLKLGSRQISHGIGRPSSGRLSRFLLSIATTGRKGERLRASTRFPKSLASVPRRQSPFSARDDAVGVKWEDLFARVSSWPLR